MSDVLKENEVLDGDETPPTCEMCGAPATRAANLSVDVRWWTIPDGDFYDDDTVQDIQTWYLCDDCDGCVPYPKVPFPSSVSD